MSDFTEFLDRNRDRLTQFPGDQSEGDLTGHGMEWSTQLCLYSVSFPEDETTLFYVLDFSLFDAEDTDSQSEAVAYLTIMVIDSEAGCNDKVYIPFDGKMLQEITRQMIELDMPHDTALPKLLPELIRQIQAMMKECAREIHFKDLP